MAVEASIARKQFNDFGQYRDQLRHWDTEAVQLSPGRLSVAFDCFDAGNLILTHLRFNQDAVLKSVRRPGWHALFAHASPKRWCGVDLPAGSLISVPAGQESRTVSHGSWDDITVVVRQDELATWQPPLAQLAEWHSNPRRNAYSTHPRAISDFRTWVQILLSASLPAGSGADTSTWVAAIRERLQLHLLAVLGHRVAPGPVRSVHRVARYDLAQAALHLVHAGTDRRVSAGNLARELGVGARAVEYAFSHVVGVSPAQYILAERLNRVRHRLVTRRNAVESVTSVALDHGFGNLSRFAMQYARLFGERPSDTLRAARRNIGAERVARV